MPRLLAIGLAYCVASLVAAAVAGLGMWIDDGGRTVTLAMAGGLLMRMGSVIGVAGTLIAAPAILYAEWRAVRAWSYYAAAGVAAGLVPIAILLLFFGLPMAADRGVLARAAAVFAAAGLAGGSAYWLIAGRRGRPWR
ncbi:MAG: hypothetical protein IT538_03080 [Variibacter sp.]|nr:hypothetical protein [Variibacter sp.]